jgi:O-antigen/teichoic acid export membrane protein
MADQLSKSIGLPGGSEGHGLPVAVNFSWSVVGSFVHALCRWGELLLLAKLGSPEVVGEFALAQAVASPILLFANLQLRDLQATDARRDFAFGDYLGLRLITTSVALLVVAAVGYLSGYGQGTALIIVAVGMVQAVEAISDAFHGLLQQHERLDRVAKSLMIGGPLSLAALGLGVTATGDLIWGVLGMAISRALVLLLYDAASGRLVLGTVRRGIQPHIGDALSLPAGPARARARTLARLAWLALPLGLVRMLMSLNANLPRYAVRGYLGQRQLGIFASMVYLRLPGSLIVTALGRSATPRLARWYRDGDVHRFTVMLIRLVGLALLLGAGSVLVAMVAGEQILMLVYQPEYASYPEEFVWLMAAGGLNYIAASLSCGMTSTRRFVVQLPVLGMTVLSAAVTCLWLVPSLGIRGAAVALVISACVRVAASAVVVSRSLRRRRLLGQAGVCSRARDMS